MAALERKQYLYILGASRDGPVKVGIACDPRARRRELQTGHPEKLEVFWIYPCPVGWHYERIIHRILASKRLSGEWYAVPVEAAMAALWISTVHGDEPDPEHAHLMAWAEHIGLCLGG